MDLAFQHQRVQGHAEIVEDGVFHHLGNARVRVDLHLDHMHAVGKGRRFGHPALGQVQRFGRRRRDLAEGNLPVGAGDARAVLEQLDVGNGGFQLLGRQLADEFRKPVAAGLDRGAADGDRARSAVPAP